MLRSPWAPVSATIALEPEATPLLRHANFIVHS